MEQYLAIKAEHKDAILFFRMGDFYEMFFEDAKTGSEVLGITLTSRAHGTSADVPLAGFPHHALDSYLAKFIKAGYRVAICEQMEDPRQAKGIVKRDVTEIVTPGTAVTDDLLETKKNNFLIALYFNAQHVGIAQIDVSTGEFKTGEFNLTALAEKIVSIGPSEILYAEKQQEQLARFYKNRHGVTMTRREDWTFHYDYASDQIKEHFGALSLKGFGIDDLTCGISAAGAILAYVRENQRERLVHVNSLGRFADDEFMQIDSTTRRNLELVQPLMSTNRGGTVLSILDRTLTPMGGRLFVNWLLYPLYKLGVIQARHQAVQEFLDRSERRITIREAIRQTGDVERLLAKFATGRANARDAQAIQMALVTIRKVQDLLENSSSERLQSIHAGLDPIVELAEQIARAIVENPPLSITDGGIIRRDYNEELDKLRDIAYSGKDWIARLQKLEREKTGISSLKVHFNKVFGYYIEITKPNLSKVPKHYIRKQTLVNAERFITQDLKEYEEKILGAEEKMASIEYELFNELRQTILSHTNQLQHDARLLAECDCLAAMAHVAIENNYVMPTMNESHIIEIKEGRHPVVEKLLPPGEQFVANDVKLDNRIEQLHIITGPNMAGKSTFLRQVGLIVIMAQMGSFVPARAAAIGLVDRVFTRVGASDNLAAGESTFLTEMNETANILNNATAKSLILLDEIGRGTSTFDGLSIAWSVTEYIHNTPRLAAKTIFATHYHELTELELVLPRVRNYNVAVREWGDHIVFLRKIVPGACDHSYGIQVAKLAGLPSAVIERAKEVLQNLERQAFDEEDEPTIAQHHTRIKEPAQQMSLFDEMERSLRRELEEINPDELTPMQALNKLDLLKQMANRQDE
ncbi:DNA mismatch repair protein MutS [candidate division KSB1 bacterium]|nr:DNA mismatch repair protein MutS [candidate division KSB1 bacterium]RQW01405.1 MAG: DNA mismatch repair protein MutS [candidate division KSB1 bacterium]